MSYQRKDSLYKDRVFGDDETPPRPAPIKSVSMSSSGGIDEDKDAYPFNRDVLASVRLNLQHQVWVSSLGYLLHPTIPMRENILVADIGCGTGIWSVQLAKQLPPGSKIEAYDLSLAQSPPEGWWPDNVTFNELDIFKPVPQHMIGRYDVIHLRLFMCVISSGDPMPLLSKLLKLLKPGGHLQWQEYDMSTDVLSMADPSGSAPKMKALMDGIRGPGAALAPVMLANWVEKFHTRIGEAGAELIAHARHWTAKDAMLLKQETLFLACREWIDHLRAKDPVSSEAARLEKLTNAAEEECWKLQRGSVVQSEMVTWVAKKGA